MRKTFTLPCLLLASLFCFVYTSGQAQLTLWPGDINNNGIVNGKDVLRWGYANGATGASRSDDGSVWTAVNLGLPWEKNFPGETNFGFGDCNGSGVIDRNDVRDPITSHFRNTHGTLQPDFCPVGLEGTAPQLKLTADKTNYGPGARINLEVALGSSMIPAVDFYGITFQLRYNRDIIRPGAVTYSSEENGWYDPSGTAAYSFFYNDKSDGIIEIAVTRTNQVGVDGFGVLGHISLILRGNIDLVLPGALNLEVDLVQMINSEMEIIPVYYNPDLNLVISDGDLASSCPEVIEPVCGSDGNTYLNSCYAEAAGIMNYTQGVCYSDCIDPDLMRPASECEAVPVDPVCGCNGLTYATPCLAEAAGLLTYTSGPCQTDAEAQKCYDPYLVVQSSGTIVNEDSGVITVACPTIDDPVCGCNGITYPNACVAEAAGIAFYTPGRCDEICIDPLAMDLAVPCENTYEPVCGCNGITYLNPCTAETAGVVDYTPGVCGPTSSWCAEAVPIGCGDFLDQETTQGAGNAISAYPACLSRPFPGPDRVYVFEKKTAGDLQIGLEILTPEIDLDLLLLQGTCDQVVCMGSSTDNNKKNTNERIVIEDAPLGTYYIVVDAQSADAAGKFRLEVNCGYLYCDDAVELECGLPFTYNNSYGEDGVSFYTCGPNTGSMENNGPEVVHYFTTTAPGEVNIELSGLSANLELFLLEDCDRGVCLESSQNPGAAGEMINTYLEPGTYYLVVDGRNGATSDYSLQVNCENACELTLSKITTTPSTCATNNGSIAIESSGGTPGYIVYYKGPVSGSFFTASNSYAINYLPSGTYQIKKIDARGCTVEETVTVSSTGSLDAQVIPTDAVCQEAGYLSVELEGGKAPYRVFLSGTKEDNLTFDQATFELAGLDPGTYDLYILDANGCAVSKKAIIQEAESNFYLDLTSYPAGCGGLGYVQVIALNGVAPYRVQLNGPVGENASAQNDAFKLTKLPGGTYQLTVEDSNECSYVEHFTIGDINLDLTTTVVNGICGQLGEIKVQVTNGAADYTINWAGPVSGTITTAAETYVIPDLPSGDYQIEVADANQCTGFDLVEVNNSGESLSSQVQPIDGSCSKNGAILLNVGNGIPPYQVKWEGMVNGQSEIDNTNFTIPDLPDGLYDLTITDKNNCQDEHTVFVNSREALSLEVMASNGFCDQDGAIGVDVSNGQANYIISWDGPETGSVNTGSPAYTIEELPSGTYQVSVTDAEGCTDQAAVEIVNAETQLTLTAASTQTATCDQLGAIVLSVSGGAATYQVRWEGPVPGKGETDSDGNLLLEGLPAGNYLITAVDQNGCTATSTITVAADSGNVGISLSAKDPVCSQSGRIEVAISNGIPDFSVSWVGPVNGVSFTSAGDFSIVDLPAGTYEVRVVDQLGCEAVDNITLLPTGELVLTARATAAACGQGDITISIDKGTPVFKMSWSGPVNGEVTTNEFNYTIPDLPDGDYTISVSDLNGCNDVMGVNVFSGSTPQIKATPQVGTCSENGSIGITISGGSPGFTLQWNGPKNGSTLLNENFFTIPDLPSGNYSIKLTDNKGCTDLATATLLNETTDLNLTTTLIENECGQENTIRLDISGGSPGYMIKWSGPQNGAATTEGNLYELKNLIAGTYQIQTTDAVGCTLESNLTVPAAPIDLLDLTAVSGNCGRSGSIKASITGGTPEYALSWSGPASGMTTTSSTEVSIDNLPGGSYTVVLTDANGCSELGLINLENNETSLEVDLSVAQNGCGQEHNIRIGITNGLAPFLINWSGPESGFITASNEVAIIEDLSEGTYEIEVADQKACIVTKTITIIEDPLELFRLRAEGGGCGTRGGIKVSIDNGEPGFGLSWDGPESGAAAIDELEYFIPDLPAGEYTVTLNEVNGCTQSKSITLQESAALMADISGNTGDCAEASSISVNILSGSPSFAISWSGPVSGNITTTNQDYEINDLSAGTYEVKITDAKGCEELETLTLNEANTLPGASFTYTVDNLSATFTHPGSVNEYLWDFGDGNSSTEAAPVYEFCEAGTYQVCLTVANDCAVDTYCTDVSVSIPEGVALLDIGEELGSAGSTVQVPVRVDQLDQLVSLIGSLAIEDEAVAGILGLSPGLITPQFNEQERSFTFYQSSQEGIALTPEAILFYIDLELLGDPGESTNIRLTDQPKPIEVGGLENGLAVIKPHFSLKGSITIADFSSISGSVSTYWGDPIPNTEVQLTSPGIDKTALTDGGGAFSFPELELLKTYTVQPRKDNFPFNGLSTYALFIGQRFILGMEPEQIYSPYQIISGDANCNGSFTTLDLFIIQQLIVGTNDQFNYCPSWVFVSEDQTLPVDFDAYNVFPYSDKQELILERDTSVNFVGVKVGDILGQANPEAFTTQAETEVRNPVYIELTADNRRAGKGETLEIPVSGEDAPELVSYQFSLNFDPSVLRFTGLKKSTQPDLATVVAGTRSAERGQLALSWFSSKGRGINISSEEPLFTFQFEALQDIEDLSELISIQDLPLPAEAHTQAGGRYKLRLGWTEDTSSAGNTIPLEFKLYQNIPNPARKQSSIRFDLPQAAAAELILHDNFGRIIHREVDEFSAGANYLIVPIDLLPGGVYYYTLKAGQYVATRSMIVVK